MIYLDNSATTKPYKEVLDSFIKVSSDYFGNPSSLHEFGGKAERLLMQAREQIAHLLNVRNSEVYFTSGGTESNNLAIKGTALMHRKRGSHIIITGLEHASVRETAEQLKDLGFRITVIEPDKKGIVHAEDIEKEITQETVLVSVMHVNNEIGSIQPINEIGEMLKKHERVIFHVDHVQGIGKVPLDLYQARVDLCTISAHKFHGLKGNGVLFIRDGLRISPILSGGNQEWRVRSGTENVAGIVAMAKALRLTMDNMEKHLNRLTSIKTYIMKELGRIEGITVHTPEKKSAPHIVNFSIKGFKAEVFVHALEERGIFISTTSACSSKKSAPSSTLMAMGIPEKDAKSAVRVSLSYGNTKEEAEIFTRAVKETVIRLREVMKL
ncbi:MULTISPECIES: cysteine desulfurase family protein [unclassified Cytobacillus]|uniref:cysteine desulfurase family protein n=1 Tax=unclassified Cytobacillus TaxID=2675268 RepID=UPI002040AA73|nr:cysteine desulfurase family protein [Cytobacillus sp. AMY 15.2]MCM3091987.1 cysteine desulfurase [Cytobacillus sp. AMY 15.2]